ncbi:MAG: hypothetical protein ACHQ2Z_09090 [Elusimicrobiota bacterium]
MIRCTLPWTQLHLRENVSVCCWAKKPLGKLADFRALEEAWNGPEIRAFRRSMAAGEMDAICPADCPHRVGGTFAADRFESPPEEETSRRAVWRAIRDGAETVSAGPLKLTVSLDDVCGLRCVMCDWNTGRWRIPPGFYDLLAASAGSLEELEILGGEPFLSRNVRGLLKHAEGHPPSYEFSFVTSLSHFPAALLRGARLKQVVASIDGATKETYEAVRVGGRWETVMKNLSALRELQRAAARPFHVEVHFTVMRRNFAEIPDAVRLFDRLAVPLRFLSVNVPPRHPESLFPIRELHAPLAAAIGAGLATTRDPSTRSSLESVRQSLRQHVALSLQP